MPEGSKFDCELPEKKIYHSIEEITDIDELGVTTTAVGGARQIFWIFTYFPKQVWTQLRIGVRFMAKFTSINEGEYVEFESFIDDDTQI